MADKTKALTRGPKYMVAWSEEIAAKLDEHAAFIQALKNASVSPQSAGSFKFADGNVVLILNTVKCPGS